MLMIGHALNEVTKILAHPFRHDDTVFLLHDKAHAALAGLTVNTDNVSFVFAAHVLRINGQIRHCPAAGILLLAPLHALGDGVLMGAGKRSENKIPRVGLPIGNVHSGDPLVHIDKFRHLSKIELWIDPQCEHIHGDGDDVGVAGTLPVAKERSFDTVGPS